MKRIDAHLVDIFVTAPEVEVALTTCRLFAEIAVPIDAFVANANDLHEAPVSGDGSQAWRSGFDGDSGIMYTETNVPVSPNGLCNVPLERRHSYICS